MCGAMSDLIADYLPQAGVQSNRVDGTQISWFGASSFLCGRRRQWQLALGQGGCLLPARRHPRDA